MLLSSSKFIRTMMDDFVDQDWFEESAEDELVKQHPMMAMVEQHQQHLPQTSPLHVPLENGFGCLHPAQPQGQTEFLELNVPVDEMFLGTSEMTLAPQLSELDTYHCSSVNGKVVQEVQQESFLSIEGSQQLVGQPQSVREERAVKPPVQQNGPETQQRASFYAEWPPTTSSSNNNNFATTVQPTPIAVTKQHNQNNARDAQRQQKRHPQKQQHQAQQQRWTKPMGEHGASGQQQQPPQYQQQDEYGGEARPIGQLNAENAFPMTRIVVHDQRVDQFPQQQPYGCSPEVIELHHQNAIFHANYAVSPCSNNLTMNQNVSSTLSGQQTPKPQQQIVVVAEQPQLQLQRNFSQMRNNNITEFRPVEQPLKSAKRPQKARPSVSSNSRKCTPFEQEGGSGANLDQIATMLFTNSNLATVQFDPQRAIEFAEVLEQTKLLREQEEQGIDVREQLHACEARIAELVQNAMAKQGNNGTATASANSQPALQGMTTKKKSKAKKKPPTNCNTATDQHQRPHIVQGTDGMAQPKQMDISMTVPSLSNGPITSTCTQPMVLLTTPEVICQPFTGNAVGSTTTDPNKFVHSDFPSSSVPPPFAPLPSSSSMSKVPASSLANSHKYASAISAAITHPPQKKASTNTKNRLTKQQIKKEEKSEEQKAQERERERVRREEERERRRTRLASAFSALRSSIPTLDYKTPFSDKMDCVKRLLPFGLFEETELSNEFLQKFDDELQRHSEFLDKRMSALKEHFQSVFFTESLCEMKEQRNLLLHLDVEFEKAQLQKVFEERGVSFPFNLASSSNLLGWEEYDDSWDRNRYKNTSPFISPAQSPENDVQLAEKGESGNEMADDDDGEIAQREREEDDTVAEPFTKTDAGPVTFPACAPLEKGITDERSDGKSSPNPAKNGPNDQELEKHQFVLNNNDNITEEGVENGSCRSLNEVQETNSPLDLSVHPFTPSESPKFSHQKTPPSSETSLAQFLNQDNVTFSSFECGNNLVKNVQEQFVAMEEETFFVPKNGTKNEFQQKSPNVIAPDEKIGPVKLTIKLDTKNKATAYKMEKSNDDDDNGKEKKGDMEKLEKKRLKMEKRERKRQAKLEKERIRKEQREREEQQPNSSSALLQNGEKPPTSLKISLRRLACWRGTTNATPEYSLKLSDHGKRLNRKAADPTPEYNLNLNDHHQQPNGKSVDLSANGRITDKSDNGLIRKESAGEALKLRIPKLILNRNEHGDNNNDKMKSMEHRKKSRKRKSLEEKKDESDEVKSPKKVPRLKIRIGSVCDYNMTVDQTPNSQQPIIKANQDANSRIKSPLRMDKPVENTDHQQMDSPGPSDFFRNDDNKQIQFSPCCSEGSVDDELRVRTNELFSKLCQD